MVHPGCLNITKKNLINTLLHSLYSTIQSDWTGGDNHYFCKVLYSVFYDVQYSNGFGYFA